MEHEQTVEYETPDVVDYGDLVELTAGTQNGDFLDAAFPAGTPKSDLTFSSTP
ncbi:MAG: lasso RiPP family leader peptide-containing protein [Gaiellaceae bacterium MAG52_C11]|nr:lasso RiPP family leader peptide-containing protein [Candidatus Gaiellasilicea maunaloa]